MHELRRAVRTQVFKPAAVCPVAYVQVTACTVRDITPFGACIESAATLSEDNFILSFDRFRSGRACRIVWRRENVVGVTFEN